MQRWDIHLCHLIVFGCCNFSFSDMRFGSSSFSDLRFGSNFYFKHFGSSFSDMRFGISSFSILRFSSSSLNDLRTAADQ